MKKKLSIIISVFMIFSLLTACGAPKETTKPEQETTSSEQTQAATEKADIRLIGLKGPTSMGMAKLIDDSAAGKTVNNYTLEVIAAPDQALPKILEGSADIAALPSNMASILYNKTEGKYQVLAINTLGVLYIVGKDESIKTVQDLKGKKIVASGKGASPEYVLRYLLSKNNIDPDKDVQIDWKSEHTEVVNEIAGNDQVVGLLPQPFVTVAMAKVEGLKSLVDLNAEWDKLGTGAKLAMGTLVINKEFAEKNQAAVEAFLTEYKVSTDYANNETAEAAKLIEKHQIFDKAAIVEKALPHCNITCITGEELKTGLGDYLKILEEQNPKSIGGKLPGEDFYYAK